MTFIIFRNYYFRITIKNLTNCIILKTFALKNNEKFADHNLEKLCPWSLALASRGSVLEKSVHGLGLRFFSSPWPWPRRLCSRLHLCLGKTKRLSPVGANSILLNNYLINSHHAGNSNFAHSQLNLFKVLLNLKSL